MDCYYAASQTIEATVSGTKIRLRVTRGCWEGAIVSPRLQAQFGSNACLALVEILPKWEKVTHFVAATTCTAFYYGAICYREL